MNTIESHYEPGEHVVAVGYVQDGNTKGPFFASLGLTPVLELAQDDSQTWLMLGEVEVEDSGLGGYLANRVSVGFDVPANLPSGEYGVAVRNAEGHLLSDLNGLTLYVGLDPGFERRIEWPLDEPLIADLAPDDVIAGPGWEVTVADLKAGNYPPGAAEFMLDPDTLPPPPDSDQTAAATTPTTASTTTTTTPSTTNAIAHQSAAAESPDRAATAQAPQPTTVMILTALGLIAITGTGYFIRNRPAGRDKRPRPANRDGS